MSRQHPLPQLMQEPARITKEIQNFFDGHLLSAIDSNSAFYVDSFLYPRREVTKEPYSIANPNAVDAEGRTALMRAIIADRNLMARILIQYSCSLNIRDNAGKSALDHAIAQDNVYLVARLLEEGADPKLTSCINPDDSAINPEIRELLQQRINEIGTEIARQNPEFLYYAVTKGMTVAVKFFLLQDRGNPIDQSLLLTALQSGQLEVANILLNDERIKIADDEFPKIFRLVAEVFCNRFSTNAQLAEANLFIRNVLSHHAELAELFRKAVFDATTAISGSDYYKHYNTACQNFIEENIPPQIAYVSHRADYLDKAIENEKLRLTFQSERFAAIRDLLRDPHQELRENPKKFHTELSEFLKRHIDNFLINAERDPNKDKKIKRIISTLNFFGAEVDGTDINPDKFNNNDGIAEPYDHGIFYEEYHGRIVYGEKEDNLLKVYLSEIFHDVFSAEEQDQLYKIFYHAIYHFLRPPAFSSRLNLNDSVKTTLQQYQTLWMNWIEILAKLKADLEMQLTSTASVDTLYAENQSIAEFLLASYTGACSNVNDDDSICTIRPATLNHALSVFISGKSQSEIDDMITFLHRNGLNNFDYNLRDNQCRNLFHHVILEGKSETLDKLIKLYSTSPQKAQNLFDPLNSQDNNGNTPLHLALQAVNHSLEIISKYQGTYIPEGEQPELDKYHRIIMMFLEYDNLRYDLKNDAGLNLKDFKTIDGSSLLHLAAASGSAKAVRKAIELGCSLNEKNNAGNTPLHAASASGNTEAVRVILEEITNKRIKPNGAEPLVTRTQQQHQ